MFAVIETKGATHIIIDVPVNTAKDSLPSLMRMLENNFVCIQRSWREATIVKPEMSIVLGNSFTLDADGTEIAVSKAGTMDIIGGEFEAATPDVFARFATARKKHEEESQRLRNEIAVLKDKVTFLEAQAVAERDTE